VCGIFDRCAGTFERILVKDLEYKTPELLFDLVRPYLTEEMNVLDLGCGTGLGSQRYRPFAKRLIGVDASSKMLEKAAQKKYMTGWKSFTYFKAGDLNKNLISYIVSMSLYISGTWIRSSGPHLRIWFAEGSLRFQWKDWKTTPWTSASFPPVAMRTHGDIFKTAWGVMDCS
jgi:SAM-dependent methyltransferase